MSKQSVINSAISRQGEMKTVRKCALVFVGAGLVLSFARSAYAQTVRPAPPKPQRIKIYFYHDPGEYIDLSPVTRVIRSASPARAAINALLAGPTRAEEKRGFTSLSSADEFAIGKLSIKDGTATINFVASRRWHGWAGDLGPVRFKKAVELTLMQFPTVKHVVVSLNGNTNFDSEQ